MSTQTKMAKADAIRAALTLLASPAPGYEFGRGRTWVERIAWALEQLDEPGGKYNGLWHDLEDIAGRLEEIARNV